MAVTIACPHCGAAGSAPEQIVGQQVRCSKCKQSFMAGGPPAPVSPPMADDERPQTGSSRDYADDYDVRRSAGPTGTSTLVEFLTFRKMVTPTLIIILFWVLVVFILLGGLLAIFMAIFSHGGAATVLVVFLMLLIGIPFSILMARIYCELMIVVFRLYETMADIRNHLKEKE